MTDNFFCEFVQFFKRGKGITDLKSALQVCDNIYLVAIMLTPLTHDIATWFIILGRQFLLRLLLIARMNSFKNIWWIMNFLGIKSLLFLSIKTKATYLPCTALFLSILILLGI